MSTSQICIVSMDNVKRVPYIVRYITCLGDKRFDFLYWDRDCTGDQIGQSNSYPYRSRVHYDKPMIVQAFEKLRGYIGFKSYASKILRNNDYKRVVCLTGNCAVLINSVLLSKYPGRYIIDIRDYWHEENKTYHEIEQRLIASSPCPVISSPAYTKFLGEHDFRIMHNVQDLADVEKGIVNHEHSFPLHIVCVGAAKNIDYDKKVIAYFANDERFKLFFRGRGYDRLSEYIAEKKIRNVNATGEFAFSKTLAQYFDADVILCMYGNGSPYWDYALANKLYFAAQLGLPILVCEKTAMADMTENFDLGIAIDLKDDKAKERIIRLFEESNVMRREQGRYLFLKEVEKDNARTFADIRNFFNC